MAPSPRHQASSPRSLARKRGLYAIADVDVARARGLDPIECALAMARGGVAVLQLRAKSVSSGELVKMARLVRAGFPGTAPPLFINDRADIAELVDAAGVHVGQSDMPPAELARVCPSLAVGLSTHDLTQLTSALAGGGLSYVALGPIFETSSKLNPEPPVGLEQLAIAATYTRQADVPLVAIGGVTEARLASVAAHADLIAAISLLLPQADEPAPFEWIEARCAALQLKIEQQPRAAAEAP